MKLLKFSLSISFLGIFLLLFLANYQKPKEITTSSNLTLNEKISIKGKIINERNYDEFSILKLQDSCGTIEIICNCKNFLNKSVLIEGKVTEYKNKKQIQAEKIQIENAT